MVYITNSFWFWLFTPFIVIVGCVILYFLIMFVWFIICKIWDKVEDIFKRLKSIFKK